MQCKEIIEIIEENYPKEAALTFDNVGLQAGRSTKKSIKNTFSFRRYYSSDRTCRKTGC